MSGAQVRPTTAPAPGAPAPPSRWVGVIALGAIILLLTGGFHAIAGVVALLDDAYYLVPSDDLAVPVSYTVWGWANIVLGVAALAAGFGVMYARMWARVLGVVVAAVSALATFAFVPAQPPAAVLIIAFDVLVIYALVVHGREPAQR